MQQYDLNPQIIDLLKQEYEMVEDKQYLRGRCPECGKKELWTWLEKPGRVQCNRTNKCDFSATTKELFPELFEKLNEKYQPTEENPTATADAYLSLIRGFDPDLLKGWYEQGNYWHPLGNKGTATVRFFLDADQKFMWERLIDDVIITKEDGDIENRNKNFKGAFKGYWWMPPNLQINEGDEVHWCEGILDAIALNLAGYKAVAIMTSGMFPTESIKPYLGKKITWIIALDNDKTGRKFLHKHIEKLQEMGESYSAILTSSSEAKKDWNDLYKLGKLDAKNMDEYRHLGKLELAPSYSEKARLIYERRSNQTYYILTFRNRTYAVQMDRTEYQKGQAMYWASVLGVDSSHLRDEDIKAAIAEAEKEQIDKGNEYAFNQGSKIREIASFRMDFLYFQQPDNGEDGQYFFRFRFANNSPEQQLPFTGKTFGSAGDFKKAAMHKAPGAHFTGDTRDLDALYRQWTSFAPKIVRTLDFIGYDRDTKTYVFNKYAVENGRIIELNAESFFQLRKSGIKTDVDIRQSLDMRFQTAWVNDFITAFGVKGVAALSWWFGTLFVEQVRTVSRSYPFFEIVGEAGSGKSDMVDFLWKLLGKEGESFNPNASTLAGRTRKMAEVSNMPVVFNETDNEEPAQDKHVKRFAWDEQKDLFDGEFGRVTGIKSQDNSTKKPRFKAGLMIVQNVPVQASEAILTRIVHLNFDRSHHSYDGKLASERLNMLPLSDTSGFLLNAVKQSERVMQYFQKRLTYWRSHLQKNDLITLQRIVENHAKIMAMADCLAGVIPEISKDVIGQVHILLEDLAVKRQKSLNEDHAVVQQFWSQFDYLDTIGFEDGILAEHRLNHSKTPESTIAVNIEHFQSKCRHHGLPVIDSIELRRYLPGSRKRKYERNEAMHSNIEKRTMRCWIFKR